MTHLSDKQRAASISRSLSLAIISALLLNAGEEWASAAAALFALCLSYFLAVSATYEVIPADSPMISFARG